MLTAAQLQTLKTDLGANTATVSINGVPTAIKDVPHGGQNAQTIADWYNLPTAAAFFGNYAAVPAAALMGAIAWKNYTPSDGVPTDTQLNVAIWQGRSLACQGQQFNLQTMISGRPTIDATQATVVQGLKDALQGIPSGNNGTAKDAGWAAVQAALCRLATNGEKLFASLTGGAGADAQHAATFTFEGQLGGNDVLSAWGP